MGPREISTASSLAAACSSKPKERQAAPEVQNRQLLQEYAEAAGSSAYAPDFMGKKASSTTLVNSVLSSAPTNYQIAPQMPISSIDTSNRGCVFANRQNKHYSKYYAKNSSASQGGLT